MTAKVRFWMTAVVRSLGRLLQDCIEVVEFRKKMENMKKSSLKYLSMLYMNRDFYVLSATIFSRVFADVVWVFVIKASCAVAFAIAGATLHSFDA